MPEADVKCPRFPTCSAPLCPAWAESVAEALWSPGEPVCRRRFPGGAPRWLVRQRGLARRGADPEQLFDAAELEGDEEGLAAMLRWVAEVRARTQPAPEASRHAHDEAAGYVPRQCFLTIADGIRLVREACK